MTAAAKHEEAQLDSANTQSDARWSGQKPSVLIFDVNETLLDIESMKPLFHRVFGHADALREWFGQLVMYSMTLTLSGLYKDYISLGQGVFEMLGVIHKVEVKPADVEELRKSMSTMPAHADVKRGLMELKDAGFRMVTLTNSPPHKGANTPQANAGLADFFERQFSVEAARAYKPAQILYHMVAQELDVPPAACCMIATHVWDTIGAQRRARCRPGHPVRQRAAPLCGLPQPNVVASDLPTLATKMIELWRS